MQKFSGVMPALVTPCGKQGEVETTVLRELAEKLLSEGAAGFFVGGSTGEGLLLSIEERRLIAETALDVVSGRGTVIVHVGALATRDAEDLARHARDCGADAVATLPPFYYKVPPEALFEHVCRVAAAAQLPTFCYHIPALTGLAMGTLDLCAGLSQIENIAGLKFTLCNPYEMWQATHFEDGRFSVFNGADEMLAHGLGAGACGGIGSTYNYQMPNVRAVFDAVQAGNFTEALRGQDRMNRVIQMLLRMGGNTATEKAIIELQGIPVGPPRGPMAPFPEERKPALRDAMKEVGLLA